MPLREPLGPLDDRHAVGVCPFFQAYFFGRRVYRQAVKVNVMNRGAGRVVAYIHKCGASDGSVFPSRKPMNDSACENTFPRSDIAVEKNHFPRCQICGQLAANRLCLAGRLALTNGMGAGQFCSSPSISST